VTRWRLWLEKVKKHTNRKRPYPGLPKSGKDELRGESLQSLRLRKSKTRRQLHLGEGSIDDRQILKKKKSLREYAQVKTYRR